MSTRTGSATALVVVDVQVGVVAQAWERERVVAQVALAVQRAREAGAPVLWVQHEDGELPRGSPAWAWVSELQPRADEPIVPKCFNSSFEATPLEALLAERGVSRVVLAGAATNWCIRATAYAALERGFDLVLLGDAHTTGDMEPAPGRRVRAESVIDDLNTTVRWLTYPGRRNGVATAAEVDFRTQPA